MSTVLPTGANGYQYSCTHCYVHSNGGADSYQYSRAHTNLHTGGLLHLLAIAVEVVDNQTRQTVLVSGEGHNTGQHFGSAAPCSCR